MCDNEGYLQSSAIKTAAIWSYLVTGTR